MKILILSWRDRTHPDGGGSELYVEQVAAGLADRGHEVTLFCAAHSGLREPTARNGYSVVPRGGRLTVYLHGLLHLLTPQGRRYDTVLDVINGLPFGTPLLRRRGVVGLIHHLHREQWQIIYPGLAGRVGWWVESWLTPRLYRDVPLVAVSQSTFQDLVGLGVRRESLTVIRNGTPPLPVPQLPRSETPLIAVLSRLVPHKRIEHAVEVVASLCNEFPGLRLVLIGDGWWREQLEHHVRAAGVVDRVEFLGYLGEQEKSDALRSAWVMVLPSIKEGWGLAITEAASVGTPSVAYRYAGGTCESIENGTTGLLVDDQAGLESAVRRLLIDRSLREKLGSQAQAKALSRPWDTTVEAFEQLLEQAACDDSLAVGQDLLGRRIVVGRGRRRQRKGE